jgi:hypothetical protein
MNTFLILLSLWIIIGFIASSILLFRSWNKGIDVTIGDIIDAFVIMLAGPVNVLIVIFTLICDMFDKNTTDGIYNRVVISGRKKGR